MLDPWIIEEIKRREEERQRESETRIEIHIENPTHVPDSTKPSKSDVERGVTVIDL